MHIIFLIWVGYKVLNWLGEWSARNTARERFITDLQRVNNISRKQAEECFYTHVERL